MIPEVQALARWAAGAELVTVALLAAFFLALARTVRLQEVRVWAAAWSADALALAALFAAASPSAPAPAVRVGAALYVAGRAGFALLLVAGVHAHARPGLGELARMRPLAALAAAAGVALGALARDLTVVRAAVALIVGVVVTSAAFWVLSRRSVPRSRWLGAGMLPLGAVSLLYAAVALPSALGAGPPFGYEDRSPFLDAAAELVLALATLVVIEELSSRHLAHINRELLASQDRLRQLVDLDPLTSLANRRRLRAELERVRPTGAAVIFLDLDEFKEINDRFGHIVGDACLLRVASALAWAFRSDDAVFRLGGDEFLVVAPGLDVEAAHERTRRLRDELAESDGAAPACLLSVGIAALAPGGEPDAALREADERMYRDKRAAKGARGRPRGGVPPEVPA